MLFEVPAIEVVKAVYSICKPVGLGFLQFQEGELSDEDAAHFVRNNQISMDYVRGRRCKFHAKVTPAGVEIEDDYWYDHTPNDIQHLFTILKEKQNG